MNYVQVILPLRLPFDPWYSTGDRYAEGDRIRVKLSGRTYTGVVSAVSDTPPGGLDPRKIRGAEAGRPALPKVTPQEMRLWRFISDYYMCTPGEVYNAAYPDEKTRAEEAAAAAGDRRAKALAKDEERLQRILSNLRQRAVKKDIEAHSANHTAPVRERLAAEARAINEEIARRETKLDALLRGPEPVRKRLPPRRHSEEAERLAGELRGYRQAVLRGPAGECASAVAALAAEHLAAGASSLVLVPGVRPQETLLASLRKAAGPFLLEYTSSSGTAARRKTLTALREGDGPVLVVGTRSALFLPFRNLAMVAVTDEESPAYKQESTPRYNGRDTAAVLASIHGAQLVLTSAWPSLETLHNVSTGKYRLAEAGNPDGETVLVDTVAEARKRGMAGSLSMRVLTEIRRAAAEGRRSLILHPYGPVEEVMSDLAAYIPEETVRKDVDVLVLHEADPLDLSGYAVVALLETERIAGGTDFRADEKTAREVASLRSRFSGTLLVQTKEADKPCMLPGDGFQQAQLEERRRFGYPPFRRVVEVTCRDANAKRREYLFRLLKQELREFAPEGPYPKRMRGVPEGEADALRILLYRDRASGAMRKAILDKVRTFETTHRYAGHLAIDADPS